MKIVSLVINLIVLIVGIIMCGYAIHELIYAQPFQLKIFAGMMLACGLMLINELVRKKPD